MVNSGRTSRRAHGRGLLFAVLLALTGPAIGGWQWPTDSAAVEVPSPTALAVTVMPGETQYLRVRPPADGEVLFIDRTRGELSSSAIPRTTTRIVSRHTNDLWSIITTDPRDAVRAAERIADGHGVALLSAGFSLFDWRTGWAVHPRALLPDSGPPGRLTLEALDIRSRATGRGFELTVVQSDFTTLVMPRELRVIDAGRVVATLDFVREESVRTLQTDGAVIVLHILAPSSAGRTVEIEVVDYDGRLRRRALAVPPLSAP